MEPHSSPGSKSAVCASVGNLGLALAYSEQSRGISVTVVAGASANPYKLERIRALGATVRIVDGDFDDARRLAWQMADIEGAFLVEDSENLDTCEGAGTIGLELIKDGGPVDAVLVSRGRRHGDGRGSLRSFQCDPASKRAVILEHTFAAPVV